MSVGRGVIEDPAERCQWGTEVEMSEENSNKSEFL